MNVLNEISVAKIGYARYRVDPNPLILVIGNFGDLVCGFNLNYISKKDRELLGSLIPRLMQTNDVRSRYKIVRGTFGDKVADSYRTYDARFIDLYDEREITNDDINYDDNDQAEIASRFQESKIFDCSGILNEESDSCVTACIQPVNDDHIHIIYGCGLMEGSIAAGSPINESIIYTIDGGNLQIDIPIDLREDISTYVDKFIRSRAYRRLVNWNIR